MMEASGSRNPSAVVPIRDVFPVSATRGQNCSSGNGGVFPEMEKQEAKLGIQPAESQAKVQARKGTGNMGSAELVGKNEGVDRPGA